MKKILLAVCGGIAAYKCCELVRKFKKAGCEVKVIMTKSAQEFITPVTMQTLSENAVHCELFDARQLYNVQHISLARWADIMVVAPATANVLGKMANGIADDLLTTVYLATTAVVYVAPAMNMEMWRHVAVQKNISLLRERDVRLIAPGAGEMACGETGDGRMAEPDDILSRVLSVETCQNLTGRKVVITAGPTQEEIDPVRFISNRSSGKMGYALAKAAMAQGGRVVLISGPVDLAEPRGVETIRVKTALEMHAAVFEHIDACDIFIGVAAVADYRPDKRSFEKIKKTNEHLTIELVKNPDILADVGACRAARLIVGFAAETNNLDEFATEKLRNKQIDIVVANDVSNGGVFGHDCNQVKVFCKNGEVRVFETCAKDVLAMQLLEYFSGFFMDGNCGQN